MPSVKERCIENSRWCQGFSNLHFSYVSHQDCTKLPVFCQTLVRREKHEILDKNNSILSYWYTNIFWRQYRRCFNYWRKVTDFIYLFYSFHFCSRLSLFCFFQLFQFHPRSIYWKKNIPRRYAKSTSQFYFFFILFFFPFGIS